MSKKLADGLAARRKAPARSYTAPAASPEEVVEDTPVEENIEVEPVTNEIATVHELVPTPTHTELTVITGPVPETYFRSRRRITGETVRISISVPRTLNTALRDLSELAATRGGVFLNGVNKNSIINEATRRITEDPEKYVNIANDVDEDQSPRSVLQGTIGEQGYETIKTIWWGSDPRPISHGSLIAGAIGEIVNELTGHLAGSERNSASF
jgi:hypothetical protein